MTTLDQLQTLFEKASALATGPQSRATGLFLYSTDKPIETTKCNFIAQFSCPPDKEILWTMIRGLSGFSLILFDDSSNRVVALVKL